MTTIPFVSDAAKKLQGLAKDALGDERVGTGLKLIYNAPVLPGGGSLSQLSEGMRQLGGVTQGARQITDTEAFKTAAQYNPQAFVAREVAQFGRKPEEERTPFGPSAVAETPLDPRAYWSDYQRLVDLEDEEPFLAQIVGGAVYDPTNVIPGVGVVGSGGKALAKGATKAVVSNSDSLVKTVARSIGQNSKHFIQDEGGFVKFGTHVNASPPPAGRTVGRLRDVQDYAAGVKEGGNFVQKVAKVMKVVNPSVLEKTPGGKLAVANIRQRIDTESMIETALAVRHDVHLPRYKTSITNDVFPVDADGIWAGTDRHWLDLMEEPNLPSSITTTQRNFITDMRKLVQEVDEMLVESGFEKLPRTKDGRLYFPRKVKGLKDVDYLKPNDPTLQRMYDTALEGAVQGVRYENNPRAVLKMHMDWAFKQVRDKQLKEAIDPISITPKRLLAKLHPDIVANVVEDAKELRSLKRHVRNLERQIDLKTVTGPSKAAARMNKARSRTMNKLQHQLGVAREAVLQQEKILAKSKRSYSNTLRSVNAKESVEGRLFDMGDGPIAIQKWRGRFMPREYAQALDRGLSIMRPPKPGFNPLNIADSVANAGRYMAASGDLGLMAIQGLPLIFRHPRAWARGTFNMVDAIFDPSSQYRYMKDNLGILNEMERYGVPISNDIMDAGRRGFQGTLKRTKGVGGYFKRMESSYNSGMLAFRVETWKALRNTVPPEDLAQYVRNLTGGLDSAALGIPNAQRKFEGGWVAFSPRLFRSTVALTYDAMQGFIRLAPGTPAATQAQKQAAQTMAQMITGITAAYVAFGVGMGKSREEILEGLNPLSGKKFLSHKVGDSWIGVGGQVRSLTQALAFVYSAMAPDFMPGGAERGYDSWISRDFNENPLLRGWVSRGAPTARVVGATGEMLTGADVVPYENVENIGDLMALILSSGVPFAAQENVQEGIRQAQRDPDPEQVLEALLTAQDPVQIVGGAIGGRTSRQTQNEAENELAQERFGVDLDELGPRDKKAIKDQVEKEGNFRTFDEEETPVSKALDRHEEMRHEIFTRLGEQLPVLGFGEPARKAIQEARSNMFQRDQAIFTEEVESILDQGDKTSLELARAQYWSAEGTGDPVTNPRYWEERDAIRERILNDARRSGLRTDLIEQRPIVTDDPSLQGILDLYDSDQELLRQYWEGPNDAVEKDLGTDREAVQLWNDYLDSDQATKGIMRENRFIAAAVEVRNNMRKDLIIANPQVEVALIRWGYSSRPITDEGIAIYEAMYGDVLPR